MPECFSSVLQRCYAEGVADAGRMRAGPGPRYPLAPNLKQLCQEHGIGQLTARWLARSLPTPPSRPTLLTARTRRLLPALARWRGITDTLTTGERLWFELPFPAPTPTSAGISLCRSLLEATGALTLLALWSLLCLGFSRRPAPGPLTPESEPARPGVSCVILTWNHLPLLTALLATLTAQSTPPEEIIVVNNGSTDDTDAWLARYHPAVRRLTLDANYGFAAAVNHGFRAARHEFVLLLNNDIELAPDFIAVMRAAAGRHPHTSIFAPCLLLHTAPGQLNAAGDLLYRSFVPAHHAYRQPVAMLTTEEAEVFGACAAAAFYRRSLLHELRGFDERFVMTYEDVDLCLRARRRGHRCRLIPSAVARHHHTATIGTLSAANVFHSLKNLHHLTFKNVPLTTICRHLPAIILHQIKFIAFYLRSPQRNAAMQGLTACAGELPAITTSRREELAAASIPFSRIPLTPVRHAFRHWWRREHPPKES